MNSIGIVPGSFDPVTLGHLDVIARARGLFDQLHVVVVHNPDKRAMLPIAQRVSLIEKALADAGLGDIHVTNWSMGLLVDYCQEVGAKVLIKGLRRASDVAYETPMAIVNRKLADIETVFLMPDPVHGHVSSSLVRQVAGLGGDISPYVPAAVKEFIDQNGLPD